MRRFLVSSLLLHICALVDPSRKSTGWFVVVCPPLARVAIHRRPSQWREPHERADHRPPGLRGRPKM